MLFALPDQILGAAALAVATPSAEAATTLLQDLALVLLTAGVVTVIFHRIRQPVVLGYILAGILVGPHTAVPVFVQDEQRVHLLSELGVILLMFSLGLHFSLRKLASVGTTAVIAAGIETSLMAASGYTLGLLFGWGHLPAIFLGAVLAISSTTITVKALTDLKLLKEKFTDVVFGILIIEDIIAIAILAILSGLQASDSFSVGEVARTLGKLSAFLAGVLVIGLLAVPRLLRYINRFKSDEVMLVATLGLCFGVSYVAVSLGYSVALGAFLIGAVVAESRQRGRIETLINPVRDMFTAIFFVAVGMQIDPASLVTYAGPILAVAAVVVIGKTVFCSVGTFIAGHDSHTSLKVGMSLSQIGEFSFIIAGLGVALQKTDPAIYPIAVAVSALTALLTPYKIRWADPLASWLGRIAPDRVRTFVDLYGKRMEARAEARRQNLVVRKLVRKWVFQVVLNGLLAAGIMIIAAAGSERASRKWPDLLIGLGGPNALVWLLAMLLILPLLTVTYRKIRAIALVIGEATARGAAPAEAAAIRQTIATTIHAAAMTAVIVVLAALSWAILPPWPVLLVLGLALVVVLATAWQRFERVYNKAQIALRETFEESAKAASDERAAETAHAEAARQAPMNALLKDAVLESIEIAEGASAAGRLIRELQLRTVTGASAVAIDRPAGSIVNPGPDEELQPGDRLLVLGSRAQLDAARVLLAANGKSRVTRT